MAIPLKPMPWHVYIVECRDGLLYTGVTNNIEKRIRDHNRGNGCRFTRYRIPVKLLHNEEWLTKSEALKREAQIKGLPRREKLELIKMPKINLDKQYYCGILKTIKA